MADIKTAIAAVCREVVRVHISAIVLAFLTIRGGAIVDAVRIRVGFPTLEVLLQVRLKPTCSEWYEECPAGSIK